MAIFVRILCSALAGRRLIPLAVCLIARMSKCLFGLPSCGQAFFLFPVPLYGLMQGMVVNQRVDLFINDLIELYFQTKGTPAHKPIAGNSSHVLPLGCGFLN